MTGKKASNWAVNLQTISCLCMAGVYVAYMVQNSISLKESLLKIVKMMMMYTFCHLAWYYLDIHKRFGFWKVSEPKSHLIFSFKSSWILVLFGLGEICRTIYYSTEHYGAHEYDLNGIRKIVFYELPDEYKFIQCKSLTEDIVWGIIAFYVVDFFRYFFHLLLYIWINSSVLYYRYWGHRVGHYAFLYKTFPFARKYKNTLSFDCVFQTFFCVFPPIFLIRCPSSQSTLCEPIYHLNVPITSFSISGYLYPSFHIRCNGKPTSCLDLHYDHFLS